MLKNLLSTLIITLLNTSTLTAEPDAPKEETVTTHHTVNIDGTEISYQAIAGTVFLKGDEDSPVASIFYTAYIKDGVTDKSNRPITFCFNGGPGSSSVWLHLGFFGPKRIDFDEEGKVAKQPFHLVDNPFSFLDISDMVFIDPVSTGYSHALPGEDEKQFHGVWSDINSIADFIRLYITRNDRWKSPKFLAGESYGTTRAAGLALKLHDNHHIYLDGIMLISSILNFQTTNFAPGNDLPYILILPTYAATALYHHKLADDLQADHAATLREVEDFAYGEYTHALMKGEDLDPEKRSQVLDKLARYTGISRDYIDDSNLRMNIFRFAKQVLKSERRTVGRFDSRIKGINSDVCSDFFNFDPSDELVSGPFAATINNYLRTELEWQHDDEYKIYEDVHPWNYGYATNQYLNVAEDLQVVMTKNTSLEVFVASGYYDLATPYFAAIYTFAHLGLDPSLRSNVTMEYYEGGHMMYLYYPALIKMKADLSNFVLQRAAKN